ncbi:J domain-containing protein [Pseudomonas asplenii]|uniref:J domain-containing protein n=1 Tax=Pseudomonas asplenii TaxID=53407 RepID=UPI00036FF2F6|nr:J domain-containing protein [Pseudomonas fuscovaginae]
MSCWEILGIPSDADTRSIKRQYATLLKRTRPDEDPEAFQRLRDAYEEALQWSEPIPEPVRENAVAVIGAVHYDTETGLQPRPTGPTAAQRAATDLLEGLTPALLDERFAKAALYYCEREFGEQLLLRCLEPGQDFKALAYWGLEHFQWLNPRLPLNVPQAALTELHQRLFRNLEEALGYHLNVGNIEGFWREYYNLEQLYGFDALEHQQPLDEVLAKLLLECPLWSARLFQSMRKLRQWNNARPEPSCPEPYWTLLLERSRDEDLLSQHMHRLQLPPNTPENRATHLLFSQMPLAQRRSFARRFLKEDWQACHQAAQKIRQNHPRLENRLPDCDAFFWRDWPSPDTSWLGLAAVMLACGVAAVQQKLLPGSGLKATADAIALWSLALGGLTGTLLWFWPGMADSFWTLDHRLSQHLSHRLSSRRPSPLVLRELLPYWLVAAVTGAWLGPVALLTYSGTMLGLAWTDRTHKTQRSHPLSRWLAWGLILGITLATLALYVAHSTTVAGRNQGLQPWPERLCSRMPTSVQDCRLPATRQQWYGKEAN